MGGELRHGTSWRCLTPHTVSYSYTRYRPGPYGDSVFSFRTVLEEGAEGSTATSTHDRLQFPPKRKTGWCFKTRLGNAQLGRKREITGT